MLGHKVIVLLACALTVTALPLNINLGAFSPAFVVGDGEISLDGENAGELMETLETGAAASADTQGVSNVANVDTAVNAALEQAQADAVAQEQKKQQQNSNNNDNPKGGKIEQAPNVKRGKLPQDAPSSKKQRRNNKNKHEKRGIAGFRTALNFAIDAQKNQPEIELGTGDEGSGVGILVNPGINVPANSAAAGAGNEKRGVDTAAEGQQQKRSNHKQAEEKRNAPSHDEKREDEKLGITIMAIAEM